MPEVDRKKLLDALEKVAPALSDNEVVPILSYFWFDGSTVRTYNDRIALQTAYKSPFKGAVHKHLLPLLQKNEAKVVTVEEVKGGNIIMQIGKTELKAALRPPGEFVFAMPDIPAQPLDVEATTFCLGVAHCLRSALVDSVTTEEMGVSLELDGDFLRLYTTNNATMSRATVEVLSKVDLPERIILPTKFCQELMTLYKEGEELEIYLTKDGAIVTANKTTLYGRLIQPSMRFNFVNIFTANFPKAKQKQLVDIPERLETMLQSAIVVTDKDPAGMYAELWVADETIHLKAQDASMQINDQAPIPKHPPHGRVRVEPRLLVDGLSSFDKMLITSDAILLEHKSKHGDEHLHMVHAKAV